MSENRIKTRIAQKHDIEANWLKAVNFIPFAGEVIIYDADENYNYPRIKIGDGEQYVSDLPFTGEYEAISDDFIHEMCLSVTEGALAQSDIQELQQQLEQEG